MTLREARGFSLIELLVVIVILGIIISIGFPSFVDTLDRRRITNATKALTGQLEQARSYAILLNRPVRVDVRIVGSGWCFGITDLEGGCDCSVEGACTIDRVQTISGLANDRIAVQVSSAGFSNVSLSLPAGTAAIVFEPTRGVLVDRTAAGTFKFTSTKVTTRQTQVTLNAIGKAKACAASETLWGGLKPC